MSDERDDLLKEIGDALRVEPSPSFAAGVRTRIAKEPIDGRGWLTWFGWVGAAATVAAGIAVFSISRRVEFAAPLPVSPPVVATVVTPVVATATPVVATPPVASAGPRVANTAARRATAAATRAAILIPTDERRALDGLLRNLRQGKGFVPPAASLVDPVTGELLPLAPIEIPPIFPDEDGSTRNRTGRPR